MRLAWLSDIHLDVVEDPDIDDFSRLIRAQHIDLLLITGDIATARCLSESLVRLAHGASAQVMFVLGNHDFYHGRISEVRRRAHALPDRQTLYLHGRQAQPCSSQPGNEEMGIIGIDGWADGRYGRPYDSDLIFTDWAVIEDFKEVDAVFDVDARLERVRELADESAHALRQTLTEAVRRYRRLLILTHVPPFQRAAGHNGSAVAELWVPWLACRATGEVIVEFARAHPDIEFEVLCGHTHVARVTHEAPNLTIRTGHAEYRAPEIQRVWEV